MSRVRGTVMIAFVFSALVACAREPLNPTYEFEGIYASELPAPALIRRDFEAYADFVCGGGRHQVLDRSFVGDIGPNYVRVIFACT